VQINDPTKMSVDHQRACLKKWYEIGYFEMKLYKPRNRKAQAPLPEDECWWAKEILNTAATKQPKHRKKQKSRRPPKTAEDGKPPRVEGSLITNLGSRGNLLLQKEGLFLYNHRLGDGADAEEPSNPEDTFPDEAGEDSDYPGISPELAPVNSEGRAQWSLMALKSIQDCSDAKLLANAVKKLALLPVCT
jgi:hypothetical protein